MALTLVIANKNYSSWSMRPWIAMKVAGIAFEEVQIPLWRDGFAEKLARYTPAGRVPVLVDGETRIWESLAILEYLAETSPALWPADKAVRAHARVVSNEMHAGFSALRGECPMNLWRPVKKRVLSAAAATNAARVDALWTDCRTRFGQGGPFLFGGFSIADAMYAPMVARFATYDIEAGKTSRAYMQAVMALPAWAEWKAAALKEPWVVQEDEVDWPTVLRV